MYWLRLRRLIRFVAGTGIYVFATLSEDIKAVTSSSEHDSASSANPRPQQTSYRGQCTLYSRIWTLSRIVTVLYFYTSVSKLPQNYFYVPLPLKRDRTHSTFPKRHYHDQRQPRNLHNRYSFTSNVALGQFSLRIPQLSPCHYKFADVPSILLFHSPTIGVTFTKRR